MFQLNIFVKGIKKILGIVLHSYLRFNIILDLYNFNGFSRFSNKIINNKFHNYTIKVNYSIFMDLRK